MISTCANGQKRNKFLPLIFADKTVKKLKFRIPFASVYRRKLLTKLIKWNFVLVTMETKPPFYTYFLAHRWKSKIFKNYLQSTENFFANYFFIVKFYKIQSFRFKSFIFFTNWRFLFITCTSLVKIKEPELSVFFHCTLLIEKLIIQMATNFIKNLGKRFV